MLFLSEMANNEGVTIPIVELAYVALLTVALLLPAGILCGTKPPLTAYTTVLHIMTALGFVFMVVLLTFDSLYVAV